MVEQGVVPEEKVREMIMDRQDSIWEEQRDRLMQKAVDNMPEINVEFKVRELI